MNRDSELGDGPCRDNFSDPLQVSARLSGSHFTLEQNNANSISERLLQIELDLCTEVNTLNFSQPVEYVYSPIEYAFNLHAKFVKKFCNSTKKVLFLGMNPGPWGMSQTGVRNSFHL